MKNLGKILLFLILFTTYLNATVTAKVEPSYVYAGDSATYMLTIQGKKVKKPLLLNICGNDITATGSQTSIESINGNYQRSYVLTYDFVPQKSCTILPSEVMIDGKLEKSNSVEVHVKPRVQDKSAEFVLSFKASKKELYIGEPFTLTLLLKQRLGAQAVDSKFIAPEFKGFWLKSESKPERTQDNEYVTTKLLYTLAPQREGNLTIEPAKLKIATRTGQNGWGTFMPQVKWRSYYSNSIKITAKKLPNNAKLIGNFTISANADKQKVNPNEAVNVTITVSGEGDLEDIESFKPYLTGVNVFEEKVKVKGNKLTQKIVFVSDKDFTIPPFELVYFDTVTQKVKKIKTEPIDIKVVGAVTTPQKLEIKRDNSSVEKTLQKSVNKEIVVQKDYLLIIVALIVGFALGIVSMLLVKSKKEKTNSIKFDIKNEKALLIRLLPYKDSDTKVAEIVAILEENIYTTKKTTIDKKVLKEILKKYNIS
jgi:hypothetical protein